LFTFEFEANKRRVHETGPSIVPGLLFVLFLVDFHIEVKLGSIVFLM